MPTNRANSPVEVDWNCVESGVVQLFNYWKTHTFISWICSIISFSASPIFCPFIWILPSNYNLYLIHNEFFSLFFTFLIFSSNSSVNFWFFN
jgi:hypothetical protein